MRSRDLLFAVACTLNGVLVACSVPHAAAPPSSAIPAPPPMWPPDPRVVAIARAAAERGKSSSVPEPAGEPNPASDRDPDDAARDEEGAVASAPPSSAVVPPTAPSSAVVPPPLPGEGPTGIVAIETPYKLGERPAPVTPAAYKRDIAELRHWGKGGTGTLAAPLPGVVGHPDPRVTLNVTAAAGPHKLGDLQRLGRRNHWINVIRCYRLGAYKDSNLRGWTKATAEITKAGDVRAAALLETELDDAEVAACIVDKLRTLKFSPQKGGTRASFEIKVGPGDEPMPPPAELILPGEGQLAPEKLLEVVEAARPAFVACYSAAFGYAPELWGRVLVRFHLTERGKLDEAFEAGTQFPDPRVSQCVVHEARKLKFPKPDGGDMRFVVGLRFYTDRSAHALPPLPHVGQR